MFCSVVFTQGSSLQHRKPAHTNDLLGQQCAQHMHSHPAPTEHPSPAMLPLPTVPHSAPQLAALLPPLRNLRAPPPRLCSVLQAVREPNASLKSHSKSSAAHLLNRVALQLTPRFTQHRDTVPYELVEPQAQGEAQSTERRW